MLAALAFLTVGISLKAALFPLHMWLPSAYAYAPSAVTAFLAATATKVSLYVLLRFYFSVFGAAFVFGVLPMGDILLGLSLAAMFVGSAAAVFQSDFKRMLAYSSVAQIGYITLGISFASKTGLTGGIVHLFNHGVTKGALFMLAGAVFYRLQGTSFERMAGLGQGDARHVRGHRARRAEPDRRARHRGLRHQVVPGARGASRPAHGGSRSCRSASSLLAVVYVWRFVEVAYFRAPAQHVAGLREAPAGLLVPAALLLAAVVFFGIDPALTVDAAARAAETLLAGAR